MQGDVDCYVKLGIALFSVCLTDVTSPSSHDHAVVLSVLLQASVMNAARELGGAAATLLPVPPSSTASTATTPQQQQQQQAAPTSGSQTQSLLERPSSIAAGAPATDFLRHQPPPPAAFRAAPEFHAPFFANGNGLFRPGFAAYQHPAHHHPAPAVLQHPPLSGTAVTNGDFGESFKKN